METKELILERKRDFYNSVCLTGIIPFLVFVYLLVNRIASFNIFVGEIGYIMLATLAIFLLGIIVGRKMLWSLIVRLTDYNQQIIDMQKELLEKNRLAAITETTLALSHEINNPLLTIRGNLELLETDFGENYPVPDSIKNRLNTIKGHCERIRQVTEKMSSLSKPVSESIYGKSSMIDLNKSK